MTAQTRSNLESPNTITTLVDLSAVDRWFRREADVVEDDAIRKAALVVAENLDHFVRWPDTAILLWPGCVRAKAKEYHRFPEIIKKLAKLKKYARIVELAKTLDLDEIMALSVVKQIDSLDSRSNGPAVVTFRVAGGTRPKRFGSNNDWSVHHLYSGKFPYLGHEMTLHAVTDGIHFTQSAGLVAIHPIADQMCDEFPFFSWMLRAKAYLKFCYDPDEAFSSDKHDEYGFVGKTTIVVSVDDANG